MKRERSETDVAGVGAEEHAPQHRIADDRRESARAVDWLTCGLPPFPADGVSSLAERPDAALSRGAITLTPASNAHLSFLRTLYATTRADELAVLPWPDAARSAFLDSQFVLQHRHYVTHRAQADYWIVAQRGIPVGRLYLDAGTPVWRLIDIALLPAARGRRIGTLLLRWLQRSAARAGADIDLHVAHDNDRAARLYARLGFVGAIDAQASHRRLIWRHRCAAAWRRPEGTAASR